MGIADLSQGAGQLLLITVALAYGSTLLAGTASYLVSSNLFPHFMTSGALDQIAATADASLKPYFSLTITPLFDTCLLYTSDAADEEDSVDIGGRRNTKKKKITHKREQPQNKEKNDK